MPKVRESAAEFGSRLQEVLENALRDREIRADVFTEPVPLTNLSRAMVVSRQFKHMSHSERQDLLWRIVRDSMTTEDLLRISTIVALSSEEFGPE